MIGYRASEAKKFFFDRKAIVDAAGRAKAKVLGMGGGLIRKIARRSMRPAPKGVLRRIQATLQELAKAQHQADKERLRAELRQLQARASAPPGQPPRTVTRLLKDFVFYVWDPRTRSVVIGPTKLKQKDGDVPEAQEKGGTVQVKRSRRGQRRVVRSMKIRPHPYMGPALEKAVPELPPMWADSVKP